MLLRKPEDAWFMYKLFQKVKRRKNQDVFIFISYFDREYNFAKAVGCMYSDTILVFRLHETAKLSEGDKKFEEGKNGNMMDQFKAILKKFPGSV